MKKVILALSFTFATAVFFACGNHEQHKTNNTTTPTNSNAATMYECPMKCEAASDKPGKCSKCKMDLVEVKK